MSKNLKIVMDAEHIKKVKDGKKLDFMAFSGYDKNQKKCRFKFRKEITDLPQKEGQYLFVVPDNKINKDMSSRYRTFWVSEHLGFTPYVYAPRIEDLPFEYIDAENDNADEENI